MKSDNKDFKRGDKVAKSGEVEDLWGSSQLVFEPITSQFEFKHVINNFHFWKTKKQKCGLFLQTYRVFKVKKFYYAHFFIKMKYQKFVLKKVKE